MLFAGLARAYTDMSIVTTGLLLYNIIAFGIQPMVGYLCDVKTRLPIALIGCGLLMIGLLAMRLVWPSLVLCALGNACFHIGGGRDCLNHSGGKMAGNGIFVSSGALGVGLGTLTGKSAGAWLWLPVALTAVSMALLIVMHKRKSAIHPALNKPFQCASERFSATTVLLLCAVSIVIRSFVGFTMPVHWKATAFLALLPSLGACAGKAAGGILGDRLGARRACCVSLLVSIPLICLGANNVLLSMAGIVLFNFSMPFTLCAIASKLPQYPGLAFGVTTLCLLVGNIPVFFFAVPAAAVNWAVAVLIVFSCACIFLASSGQRRTKLENRYNEREEGLVS